MRREGIRSLYRGILPPLLQRTSARCLMFGMFDEYCYRFGCGPSTPFKPCHSMAAFCAGCTEAILCPFERVQTLLQSPKHNGMFKNALDVFKQLRKYGLFEYYRGLTPVILRNGFSNILFFSLRQPLKDAVTGGENLSCEMVHSFGDFVSGAVLGALISTVFFPLNMLKTRKQAVVGGPFDSLATSFRRVMNERGNSVRKLYYGVHINYTRSMITWGITNAVYEFLERHIFHSRVYRCNS